MAFLDPTADLTTLTRAIVDIESVSGNEKALADAVEAALKPLSHLEVIRDGDTVIARTNLGRERRVVIAGHLDTVPVANNLPSGVRTREGRREIYGRGTCDMKGGDAVFLKLAAELTAPSWDITWIFYDHEEVAAADNSLTRIAAEHPEYLRGDFAILGEPSNASIEAGCKGTMRLRVSARGVAAHSARDWIGSNAIHALAGVLTRLAEYTPRVAVLDGLEYRECLNAVRINGGIAGNVIPDAASVEINYRFAPDTSPAEAEAHVRSLFADLPVEIELTDCAAGAMPSLSGPVASEFVSALGVPVSAKQGWTDVARFTALGVPAVNFGPGDPLLAHTDDEHIPENDLAACYDALRTWLGGGEH
ncbi:succinyl-diaminopimelate desuccinylase [Dermabacteraceae bacterium P7054]